MGLRGAFGHMGEDKESPEDRRRGKAFRRGVGSRLEGKFSPPAQDETESEFLDLLHQADERGKPGNGKPPAQGRKD
jgi:hypothetical protein